MQLEITNQHPTKFIIYASNDGANWKEIKVFTAEADGLSSIGYHLL